MTKIEGRVILASGSPQRKDIMINQLGYTNVEIVKSGFPENLSKDAYAPFEYAIQTARHKALDVYRAEANADIAPELLIAADTVIELNGIIMEKPRGIDHHIEMLKKLRDNPGPHRVYTGLAAIVPYEKPVLPGYSLETSLGVTHVKFRKDITDKEIIDYVTSGEASDAAGGYKIQGAGGKFVESINGDRFNVIGLPIDDTKVLIKKTWDLAQVGEDELQGDTDEEESYY
ncbi:nucleotide diphosphatase [Starmerella bacillaris]|uniref:Nucleotide diphosphatase n=1 Tax=Starmerella bacillaris TaxID=1247836 RepID=A0AAV5RIZ5_STABA|nr:nucleotide diphosphatase [Starmerella bacillaris]